MTGLEQQVAVVTSPEREPGFWSLLDKVADHVLGEVSGVAVFLVICVFLVLVGVPLTVRYWRARAASWFRSGRR